MFFLGEVGRYVTQRMQSRFLKVIKINIFATNYEFGFYLLEFTF